MSTLLKKEYLTKVDEIDKEHQRIVTSISNLGKLVGQDKTDVRKAKRAVVTLGSYVRVHTSYEEEWMSRNVEQFNGQGRDVNNKFLTLYQELRDRADEKGNYVEPLEILYESAKAWFTEHMNSTYDIICEAVKNKA